MNADPDIMAWRAELAFMSFEGAFLQVKGVVRFLELEEYKLAITALERALPFWKSALDEMREIRTAIRADNLTGEAAAEYRAQRDQGRDIRRPAKREVA